MKDDKNSNFDLTFSLKILRSKNFAALEVHNFVESNNFLFFSFRQSSTFPDEIRLFFRSIVLSTVDSIGSALTRIESIATRTPRLV